MLNLFEILLLDTIEVLKYMSAVGVCDFPFPLFQGSSYAVGNASYHNSDLYVKLKPAILHLVDLLRDPVTKTRANAASELV